MTFGEKLTRLIDESNLSQNGIARSSKIHSKTLIRWKNEEAGSSPTMEHLVHLARFFKVDLLWLIDDAQAWEDQPDHNAETSLMAQAIQLVTKIGAAESIRRLKHDSISMPNKPGGKTSLTKAPSSKGSGA